MVTCLRTKGRAVAAVILTVLFLLAAHPAAADPAGDERPSVAVVLGGGAARGLSHIGLLRALAEAGIPVDMVVGTSMGSLVAGMYAAGLSVDNLEYLVTTMDLGNLFEPLLPPRGGIVGTERLERFINYLTNNATFDSVPVPFYSVVTHLESGQEVVWHTGLISRGMRASMSIPGTFPPVELDGEYYVDGGVAAMVPVEAARQLGADFVIAVDVRGQRVDPIDVDNPMAVLNAALGHLLKANADAQLGKADVIIFPDIPSDSGLDYDRAAEFIAAGYAAAQKALPEIRERLLALDPDFPFGSQPPPPGWPQDEFAELVTEAYSLATSDVQVQQLAALPSFEMRGGEPSRLQLGVDVPLGTLGRQRLLGTYSLQGTSTSWVHTFGLGVGTCRGLCAAAFVRRAHTDAHWSPGVLLEGVIGDFHYAVEWERPADVDHAAWHGEIMYPLTAEALVRGRQIYVQAHVDPRGMYGPPSDAVRADALLRWYLPAEKRNVLGIFRGATHWYAGAGLTAAWNGAPTYAPLLEAGLVADEYLFGLYPLRLRLALTYRGDASWGFRISLGE